MALKRSPLGRGLDSLISMDDAPAQGSSAINEIELDRISPNPDQPRTTFDNDSLEELAASIRELGIVQPLSLRKIGPDTYQIIAGERRYRAARLAGLTTVPAYIRTANDSELTEMALIENIQREDLNAIEIALTFKKLMDQYGLTQERLSERIGKKRATVANFLRLLRLPAKIQLGLRDRSLDMGHARALLILAEPSDQLALFGRILKEGLSVRRVEQIAKEMQSRRETGEEAPAAPDKRFSAHDFDALNHHLTGRFGTPVKLSCDRYGRGRITFSFADEEQLEKLIAIFDELKS